MCCRFSLLSVQVHDGYGSPGFDMAILDQGVWLLSRFHVPFSTVMGRNFFADHTSFIFLLAVPAVLGRAARPGPAGPPDLPAGRSGHPDLPAGAAPGRRCALADLAGSRLPAQPGPPERQPRTVPCRMLHGPVSGLAIYAAVESKGGPARRWPRLDCCCARRTRRSWSSPLAIWVFSRRDRSGGVRFVVGAVAWWPSADSGFIYAAARASNVHGGRLPFGGIGGTCPNRIPRPGRSVRLPRAKAGRSTCGRWCRLRPAGPPARCPRSPPSGCWPWPST